MKLARSSTWGGGGGSQLRQKLEAKSSEVVTVLIGLHLATLVLIVWNGKSILGMGSSIDAKGHRFIQFLESWCVSHFLQKGRHPSE